MADIKEEISEKSPSLAEAEKFASGQNVALDETKAQIMFNGDTMIIVLPLEKIGRTLCRGILLDAADQATMHYMQMAKRKPAIIKPGIMDKIGGLIH